MKQKIIVVGATGTIGRSVVAAFKKEDDVIETASKSGTLQVDITSVESIKNLFEKTGSFDALISTTGTAYYGPFKETTDKDFRIGIDSKLMGQINLVLIGQHYINRGGSFTLTSGIIYEEPILNGSNFSTVNGAINSFVQAAAIDFKNEVRINAVSPSIVENSPEMFSLFPGYKPVTMQSVSNAYIRSVKGALTGHVFKVN